MAEQRGAALSEHSLLSSSAAGPSFDARSWERDVDSAPDALVARLVRRRLAMERQHGWVVLALLLTCLVLGVVGGTHFKSQIMLAGAAAMAATFGIGLSFYVEGAFLRRFVAEGRELGLTEAACRRLFQRGSEAGKLIEVMGSCGAVPSDAELARFVR
jgi:hypothetical protein